MGTTHSSSKNNKWHAITTTIVTAAAEASKAPASGDSSSKGCPVKLSAASGGEPSTSVTCKDTKTNWSQWWLESHEVDDAVFQGIHCKTLDIGTSHTNFTGQSPCCMVNHMAEACAKLFASDKFTQTEKDGFWAQLVGIAPKTIDWTDTATVTTMFYDQFHTNCNTLTDSNNQFSASDVTNLFFGADSSTICNDLLVATSQTSQSVMCMINGMHKAQCAMSSDSCAVPTPSKPLPTWAWVLIAIAAVIVLLIIADVMSLGIRKNRRELSGEGILAADGSGLAGLSLLSGTNQESAIVNELGGQVGRL